MSNPLCQYKDSLGQPGKGVHSYRIFDLAVVDIVLTILLAWGISYQAALPFGWTLLGCFLTGILVHRLFCVRTKIDQVLEKAGVWG